MAAVKMIKVKVIGARRVVRDLRRFPISGRFQADMAKAEVTSARLVSRTARKLAPKDTGKLKRSIGPRKASVVSSAPYSKFVHYGHRTRGGGRYSGVPYIDMAIKQNYDKIMVLFRKAIRRSTRRFNIKHGH